MKKIFCIFLLWIEILFCTNLMAQASYRLLFTGDIMLAREVNTEIIKKEPLMTSPWNNIKPFFSKADWIMGNLEGTVGNVELCHSTKFSPCFVMSPNRMTLIKQAGFNALGVENNHSADLGDAGKIAGRDALIQNHITPLSYNNSPQFLRIGHYIVAMIALSNVVGRDGNKVSIPSNDLLQKLQLAKALSNWVIVYIHWGSELMDWPSAQQRKQAQWLIEHGADAIVGHHPHVVQNPQCVSGKPVFFSLGNHVFDQKYPETKQGLIAECFIDHDQLQCHGVKTQTPEGSFFPSLTNTQGHVNRINLKHCSVAAHGTITVNGYRLFPLVSDHHMSDGDIAITGLKSGVKAWVTMPKKILGIGTFRPNPKQKTQFLFLLEKHPSPIDNEISPRPYVYAVTSQGLIARWRGSALAWPLINATIINIEARGDYLCALHRDDSFLLLNPKSHATRTAVYRWNGFGFSGIQDSLLDKLCKKMF